MSDLISRQAAIDALCSVCGVDCDKSKFVYDGKQEDQVILCPEHYALTQLPSAQPERRWTSCEERMPEEHEWMGTKRFGTTISDEVYVTFEAPDGQRFTQHINFQNGELSPADKQLLDVWFKGAKPIAWKPLPEPYREEGEDDAM